MHSIKPRQNHTFLIWFCYLFFVAYGSFVPFNFNAITVDQAWEFLHQILRLEFGEMRGTDWNANIVLGIPTGFLTVQLLSDKFTKWPKLFIFLLAGLISAIFIVLVESSQIFFPPRTCSINDILAQAIGCLIGLLLAIKYSNWFNNFLHAIFSSPEYLPVFLFDAYLVFYIAFALFPYDILLSGAELVQKAQGANSGWLLAEARLSSPFLTVLKFLIEILLTIPMGLYLGRRSGNQPISVKQAILFGFFFGSLIEIAQFFIASGISEGLSVITRITGVCLGLLLWRQRREWSPDRLARAIRHRAIPLGIVYLLILLQTNGWFSHRWQGIDVAISGWDELHFLPFYYHYFTTEAQALLSSVSVCLSYAPIGILIWSFKGKPVQAFYCALLAAFIIESGKLFLQDMHPDPTNLLLGGLASWAMIHLIEKLTRITALPDFKDVPVSPPSHETQNRVDATSDNQVCSVTDSTRNKPTYAVLFVSLAFTAYWAATFPTQPVILLLLLAAAAIAIWYRPVILIPILLAALPALDLTQWSGRFYLDEFDLLMLISLAIGYARVPAFQGIKRQSDIIFSIASSLLAISFVISCARGLLPWQSIDANSFTNYYSPFNAVRIAKGALWAFLCYGLLKRMHAAKMDIHRPFTLGMVAGLALTVAVILWERVTFGGLFNFSSDYRVTGPFSSMHIGGAYIECFLTVATPFLILFILQTRNWLCKISGVVLLLATTYALMVTFSRSGYLSFGAGIIIILFFFTFRSGRRMQRGLITALLSGAIVTIAIPVFTGEFAQMRIASISGDLAARQALWNEALNFRTPDLHTTLFGMGLGRFPETAYLLGGDGNRSGSYQLVSESQNIFLRLVPGLSIFMGQRVSVEPNKNYILEFDARANRPDAALTVPICEKWLLSSYGCMWSTSNIGKHPGVWQHFRIHLVSDQMSVSRWYSQRPVKLALFNGNANAIVDIDNIRLETIEGNNLLRNGDFSKGLDHWFFTEDGHLQSHIENLAVAVLFDQGWFGLLAMGMFIILAVKRGIDHAWRGNLNSAVALASFGGFLVLGLLNTLIDAPRFLFLFLLLGFYCAGFAHEAKHQ